MSPPPDTHFYASTYTDPHTGDVSALSELPLDLQAITASVRDDGAGAICSFTGTTRDSFEGKRVLRLSYESYTPLCLKTFSTTLLRARSRWPDLKKLALHHRLGNVPVGEASIVVAVSSAHRRASFEACEWVLEEVKREAQVWKREEYAEEGEGVWKENFGRGMERGVVRGDRVGEKGGRT